jgi:uncharacterized Tic20 family protein
MDTISLLIFCLGVLCIIVGVWAPFLGYFVKEWSEAKAISIEDAKKEYLKHRIEYFIYDLKSIFVIIILVGNFLVYFGLRLYF